MVSRTLSAPVIPQVLLERASPSPRSVTRARRRSCFEPKKCAISFWSTPASAAIARSEARSNP
jgi:hypothetical protein